MLLTNRWVMATANQGKAKEVAAYLAPLGIELVTLADLPKDGMPDWEEVGDSFEENALIKAGVLSEWLNSPVIADDSGLCVDAFHGGPGVRSARFAGEHATDEQNNNKLLIELERVKADTEDKRAARFVCALAVVDTASAYTLTVRGTCEGHILFAPQGEGGFGYDPLFWLSDFQKTMAQLTIDEKNAISHRGNALKALIQKLKS